MDRLSEMKILGVDGRLCAVLLVVWLTTAAPLCSAFNGETRSAGEAPLAAKTVNSPLHALLESAMLPGLKWPRFADHRQDLQRLYQIRNDKLLWTVEGKPSQQAVGVQYKKVTE